MRTLNLKFPAPREVDRYLYTGSKKRFFIDLEFPAPLEVDRYLYLFEELLEMTDRELSFRPLSR